MNDPNLAGRYADARRILNVTEVTPGLPFPNISSDRAVFYFVGLTDPEEARETIRDARTVLAYALGAVFIPRRTKLGSASHYILTAKLPSGLLVELVALAEHIDGDREDAPEPELAVA